MYINILLKITYLTYFNGRNLHIKSVYNVFTI